MRHSNVCSLCISAPFFLEERENSNLFKVSRRMRKFKWQVFPLDVFSRSASNKNLRRYPCSHLVFIKDKQPRNEKTWRCCTRIKKQKSSDKNNKKKKQEKRKSKVVRYYAIQCFPTPLPCWCIDNILVFKFFFYLPHRVKALHAFHIQRSVWHRSLLVSRFGVTLITSKLFDGKGLQDLGSSKRNISGGRLNELLF